MQRKLLIRVSVNTLVRTGRTSGEKPNPMNMPRGDGIRTSWKAPAGHVLVAVDYSQQELVALAQTMYNMFGHSKLRDTINAGIDAHRLLGAEIMKAVGGEQNDGTDWRQMAKAGNFGYPGGLGATTFIAYAKQSYGVTVTPAMAATIRTVWQETFPEMREHLKGTPDPKNRGMYIGATLTGRSKPNALYTAALNYRFQGFAADCTKRALWYLWMQDAPTVNEVH